MVFDRSFIEAKLALKRIGPAEMPSLACDALEAGFDGPSIRRLASLINPSGWETDQMVRSFMAEAGLEQITIQEAAVRVARQTARRILSEGLDPLEHTRDFELLWLEADHAREIQDAGTLEDDKATSQYQGQTVAQFREYARSVLVALVNRP